jgi:hypothetical protein
MTIKPELAAHLGKLEFLEVMRLKNNTRNAKANNNKSGKKG